MEFVMREIGVIHTPFASKSDVPIQASRSDIAGSAEIDPAYAEGLEGIEEFSHIYLLYGFHHADPQVRLKIQPFLDDQLHGIFATRYPVRPNPLGLSIVRMVRRMGNTIEFQGADMLDGTPLLDIKPYIPEFDIFEVTKTGWYSRRKIK